MPQRAGRTSSAAIWNRNVRRKEIRALVTPSPSAVKKEDASSLLQIYQKSENSIRLVLLDEAFSKMTSDRIRPMMELFRRLQLQVLLISTVEKSTAIQPYCDITYSIVRHGDANAIAPFVRVAAE